MSLQEAEKTQQLMMKISRWHRMFQEAPRDSKEPIQMDRVGSNRQVRPSEEKI